MAYSVLKMVEGSDSKIILDTQSWHKAITVFQGIALFPGEQVMLRTHQLNGNIKVIKVRDNVFCA